MPSAYADRRKLTRAIHAQYLAPFPGRSEREQALWTLARSLLGSSPSFGAIWEQRERLAAIPSLVVWGLGDSGRRSMLANRKAIGHDVNASTRLGDRLVGTGYMPPS